MSGDDYRAFRERFDDRIRSRYGQFREVDGGGLEVDTAGHTIVIGMINIAQKCAAAPRSEWTAIIDAHLAAAPGIGGAADESLEEIRDQIKVRIYPLEAFAGADGKLDDFLLYRTVAPGLLAALAIDNPSTVQNLAPPRAAGWGLGVDELFELGLRNVREQDRPEVQRVALDAEGSISFLQAESFFTATWILMLDQFAGALPAAGAIVAVPTRHHAFFVPIVGAWVERASVTMLQVAAELFDKGPGSISPHLYWCRGGTFTPLTTLVPASKGAKLRLEPPPEFIAAVGEAAQRP